MMFTAAMFIMEENKLNVYQYWNSKINYIKSR